MISLKLIPDKRRMKKDRTYPLIFRMNYNGQTRDIKVGYSVKESDWNTRTNFLKETHPDFKVVAPRINELRLLYLSKLGEYEKANGNVDLQDAKEFLVNSPKKKASVYAFWEAEISQLYKANRSGGAQVYKEALTAVNKLKSLHIPFEKLDYNFLREVETGLLNVDNGMPSITFSPSVLFFPNPSTGIFTISSQQTIHEIRITNMLGQTVLEASPHSGEFKVEINTPGVYFVTVTERSQATTRKLVIN